MQPSTPVKPEPDTRTGTDLIDAAAAGEPLTDSEPGDLLDYFLTNKALPGADTVKALTVELGDGPNAKRFSCAIHPVEWSEWQDAIERATDPKTNDFDRYVAASWCTARALVTPKLGPAVVRMQKEAQAAPDGKIDGPPGDDGNPTRIGPPTDGAHLLRRMFAKCSGALLELNAQVLTVSRLANDSQSVREVEAGKG